MDTPLEAALLAVVEGALRGTSADWTGGGCPQCRRSGGALVRACTVFSRLSGAGTPLVSAVMLSAEKRSSGLGSRSAPRAHRCCPDPQPGVGGACVSSLSLGHSPGHARAGAAQGLRLPWQQRRAVLAGRPRRTLWVMSSQESPAWVLAGAAAGARAGAELPVTPTVLAPGCCPQGPNKDLCGGSRVLGRFPS